MVTQSAPAVGGGSRFVIMLSGMIALVLAAGACTSSGRPGGHAIRSARATAASSPALRRSAGHSVQLVVEASGDLLIHSAIFNRALVLGGGRHYDFAPMFAQIKPAPRPCAHPTSARSGSPGAVFSSSPSRPTCYMAGKRPPPAGCSEGQGPWSMIEVVIAVSRRHASPGRLRASG
jgi:hypothetical protein